jgi:hypothetical protein
MSARPLALLAAFCAVSLAAAAAHMTLFPVAPLAPDSAGYLNADGMRSAGYPAFLALAKAVGLDVHGIIVVQTVFLATSVGTLASAMGYASGRIVWGLALLGALCGNPFMWRYGAQILSEALFIPLLCLMAACMLMPVRHEARRLWFVLSALCLAAAILVRPVAMVMLPGLLLLVLGLHDTRPWGKRVRDALVIFALVFSITTLTVLVDKKQSDSSKGAIQGHASLAALGQAALLLRAGQTGLPPDREARIIVAIEQTRAWLNGLSSWEARVLSREIVWNPLLYEVLGSELDNLDASKVARTAILAAPLEYVRVVAAGLYSLWTLPQLQGAAHWRDVLEPQLSTLPQPVSTAPWRDAVKRMPDPLALVARVVNTGLTGLAFLAACLTLYLLLTGRRIEGLLLAGGALGLAAHGYLVAVALFSASLPRYQMPVLPLIGIAALCVVLHVTRRLLRRPEIVT